MRELKSEVKNIITKSSNKYSHEDMIQIVEEYIRLRKGLVVCINRNNLGP